MADPAQATPSPQPAPYIFYRYNPSLPAAAIFMALFAISTSLHIFQLIRRRTWYFLPFVIGGIFECGGYAGRIVSSKQTPNWTEGPYIVQSLLLLLAPALFAASIYMVLGRIILLTDGEEHSLIRAKWLTKVFVLGDVLSFLTQSTGGGILASNNGKGNASLGQNIITAGLGIQVLFFGFFIVVGGLFHFRLKLLPTTRSLQEDIPWERYMWALYIASICILIRSVFRVVEYVMGEGGYLLSHEIFLYIFDATLMLFTMAIYNVLHPSTIIYKKRHAGATCLESQDSGYALDNRVPMVAKP
ncbi:hypothetical protein OIDMADRAFT_101070 [Oidiodendron maius Zn]|uniref:RTA1 like protein n=1 Tax=Oidiodendron maius (strain Zn) TaxID=913774 RepID=A0A0C3HVQ5_OIDMZ|nr:hypothetical protein OIDMADRAFT_101070 [Oidiodendron maius Zn]